MGLHIGVKKYRESESVRSGKVRNKLELSSMKTVMLTQVKFVR